ncbi:penicillin-binding transpeptidase domain-containing protein [Selenomonas sp. TAMA-11512]|uniref:peptidoglycan D,D-transpeptidase FtsI family protein n=1 Tax=Selenomonas sp. TAMA-11512 TaxID=3095337 RepID=UPI00308FD7F3|nr:penicillin-binding transpeptidase domain-containing protein [Selenomonas sp. TAMA-11512]
MDERIKKRKRWIIHTAGALLLAFLVLAVYIGYVQVIESEDLISSPYNRRYATHAGKGRILDRNGIVLAETDADGRRQYPYGAVFSHVVGYNEPEAGSAGVESSMADALVGKGALRNFGPLRNLFTEGRGSDVVLTLDAPLQETIYNAIGDRKGAAIVMDASTGKVLAMVSKPSYDPRGVSANWDALRDAAESPLLNRAAQGLYPPGSVIKPMIADAALTDGKTNADEIFHCDGVLQVGSESIRESHGAVHGDVHLADAVAESCNVAFSTLALRLGADGLEKAFHRFGFDAVPDGLDFIAAAPVLPAFHTLSDIDTALVGIGQSTLLVTPLSMLLLEDAFANRGKIMKPQIIERIVTSRGLAVNAGRAEVWMQPTTEAGAEIIDRYMLDAVRKGTGGRAEIANVRVTGKTGTAETGSGQDHAWFIGSAEYGAEKIVFVVLVENGGGGGRVAAPIAKEIIETWMENRGDRRA